MIIRPILFVLLLCFSGLDIYAASTINVNGMQVSTPEFLLDIDRNWVYHAGDSMHWKDPAYNDAHWQKLRQDTVLNPSKRPYESNGYVFDGIGWYRTTFTTDSSYSGEPASLITALVGAAEIYLDGQLIKRLGVVGNSKESEERVFRKARPIDIYLKPNTTYTLAMRYSNFQEDRNNFSFVIIPFPQRASNLMVELRKSLDLQLGSFVLVLVVLSLLHIVLWLFYREQKSNLYFSLFLLIQAAFWCSTWVVLCSDSLGLTQFWMTLNPYVTLLGLLTFHWFQYYFLTGKRWPRIIKFTAAISAVVAIVCMIGYQGVLWGFSLIYLFVLGFDCLRVLFIALLRKKPGSTMLAIGQGLSFITPVLAIIIAVKGGDTTNMLQLATSFSFFMLLFSVLSIPASMTVFLARNIANTNKRLKLKLNEVERLTEKTIEQEKEKRTIIQSQNKALEEKVKERTASLEEEKRKSDVLLQNILPAEVAEELKETGSAVPRRFDNVSVMFIDIKGFTTVGSSMAPESLVEEIDYLFKGFDEILSNYQIEKIKTIGDAYMCASGLPSVFANHCLEVVRAAIDIQDFMRTYKTARIAEGKTYFEIRIGIHSGPVVAGIVGIKKFAYDIWGDTVNTASRMESASEVGQINISESTYSKIKADVKCIARGEIEVKNKGKLKMYYVEQN